MLVGSVGGSFGLSRLWHDPNYEPIRDYRPVAVRRGLQEAELPKEEHLLPAERPEDPYQKLEDAYDVAAAQMRRGAEAQGFLHGRAPSATAFDAAVHAARDVGAQELRANIIRETVLQPKALQEVAPGQQGRALPNAVVAPGQVVRPAGTTQAAQEREAVRATQDANDASELVDAVSLAGGGLLSGVASVKLLGAPLAATHIVSTGVAMSTTATLAAGAATTAGSRTDDADADVLSRRRR